MTARPVLAYHLIFGTYGFWLPNDPRGSWSIYVGNRELYRFGAATKTDARQSVAHRAHDHDARLLAKRALAFPAVRLSGVQARAVTRGIGIASTESDYVIHACAILPDHVHLVVARHQQDVRRIATHVKSPATRQLKKEGLWPDSPRSIWAKNGWSVFLFEVAEVRRTIRYVEQNPVRDGKRKQSWSFVVPYEP